MREIYNDEKVKVLVNDEKKVTTAVVEGCELNAIERIEKVLKGRDLTRNFKKALLPEKINAKTTCLECDTFDEKEGRRLAINKVMEKHNRAFKNALMRWQVAMLRDIQAVSPETFKDAVDRVAPCKCRYKL